jgi:tRNA-splicing ligase RtcB (3'-phosphate/5'-hydroxy nucleic acid ligase)
MKKVVEKTRNNIVTSKDLDALNIRNNSHRSMLLPLCKKHFKHQTIDMSLDFLKELYEYPDAYIDDEIWGTVALAISGKVDENPYKVYELNNDVAPYKIYGRAQIEPGAIHQMEVALKLPIASRGALLPDAHVGYGLPIGGVLATEHAVIPYAVGVDIGCRMAMTIFEGDEHTFSKYAHKMKNALSDHCHFGLDGTLPYKRDHEIMESDAFDELPFVKLLKGKAWRQLGTSGTGNHFVEWGMVTIENNNNLSIKGGSYIALLSHSGSRGLGAAIATHYSKLAMDLCRLPHAAKHLAWLSLDSSAGQEYWHSMQLAGAYAKACHEVIHNSLAKASGLYPLMTIDNHHNFAWKSIIDGKECIVHRKGATPTEKGTFGIIPGSMIHPGYIVSGKGCDQSLMSASHGAGRAYSRSQARSKNTIHAMNKMLSDLGITLIGGSTEEAPSAYKNIDEVMLCQQELVNIEGKFFPKIVRMNRE